MQEKHYNQSTAYRDLQPSALLTPSNHFHLFPSNSSENQNAYQAQPAIAHLYQADPAQFLSQISPYHGQVPLQSVPLVDSRNSSLMKPPPTTYQFLKQQRESFQKDKAATIHEQIQQSAQNQNSDQNSSRFQTNLWYQQTPNFAKKEAIQQEDSGRFHTSLTYRHSPDISINELNRQKQEAQKDDKVQDNEDRSNFVRIMPQNTYDMSSSRKFSLDSDYRKDSERSVGESKRKICNRNKIKHKTNDSDRTAGRWKSEEHEKFVQGLRKYGRDWKKVQYFIGSRSGAQIRSHAQKFFNKIAKQFNISDPAEFVISGEFQKRLNNGALSQSMQQSTFLVNNNMYSEDQDASIHSHVSANKHHLHKPSSFAQKSHNNSVIESQNNTPTKQTKKKKIIDEEKQQQQQKKIIGKNSSTIKFLIDQNSEQTGILKQHEKDLAIQQSSSLMNYIKFRYQSISKKRAVIASRIQDTTDDFIIGLIHNCKMIFEKEIQLYHQNFSDNQELEIISEKLKVYVAQLQEIMQIRKNKHENQTIEFANSKFKPLKQQIAGAKSYFRNVILPSLGCRDTHQMLQKYPHVADWSMVSFSQHPSSSSSDCLFNKIQLKNSNNAPSGMLGLH